MCVSVQQAGLPCPANTAPPSTSHHPLPHLLYVPCARAAHVEARRRVLQRLGQVEAHGGLHHQGGFATRLCRCHLLQQLCLGQGGGMTR